MIWLGALAALPYVYILMALLREDWEQWLTPRKMAVVIPIGRTGASAVDYFMEQAAQRVPG